MAQVTEGGTFAFTVVAKSKSGRVVPVTDAAVALGDPALGTVSVNGDGSNGAFVAGSNDGTEAMVPSAGGVTGTLFSIDITPDLAVATVEIVPA